MFHLFGIRSPVSWSWFLFSIVLLLFAQCEMYYWWLVTWLDLTEGRPSSIRKHKQAAAFSFYVARNGSLWILATNVTFKTNDLTWLTTQGTIDQYDRLLSEGRLGTAENSSKPRCHFFAMQKTQTSRDVISFACTLFAWTSVAWHSETSSILWLDLLRLFCILGPSFGEILLYVDE
jgi:hypothetical protein